MKVVIAGASGFIGRALVEALASEHEVVALNLKPNPQKGVRVVVWDGVSQGDWAREIDGADAVVNLSGAPVSVKWTEEHKEAIVRSRVDSTRAVGVAIAAAKRPPKVWVNGSASGYYGDTGDQEVDETAPPGDDFLAQTCVQWEAAVHHTETPATRKVQVRTGVVLGPGGGALEPLLGLTKAFLGGSVGSGRQWVPWIHREDEVGIIRWAIDTDVEGPVNACAPTPVRNEELMETLRHVVGRPWAPPAPKLAVEIVGKLVGPEPEIALVSIREIPRVAQTRGFTWRYPNLEPALRDVVQAGDGGTGG